MDVDSQSATFHAVVKNTFVDVVERDQDAQLKRSASDSDLDKSSEDRLFFWQPALNTSDSGSSTTSSISIDHQATGQWSAHTPGSGAGTGSGAGKHDRVPAIYSVQSAGTWAAPPGFPAASAPYPCAMDSMGFMQPHVVYGGSASSTAFRGQGAGSTRQLHEHHRPQCMQVPYREPPAAPQHIPNFRPTAGVDTHMLIRQLHQETSVPISDLLKLGQSYDLSSVPRHPVSGAILTVGSIPHAEGTCKPCVFWTQRKCIKSILCTFCHFKHKDHRMKRKRPSKKVRDKTRALQAAQQADDGLEDSSSDEDVNSSVQQGTSQPVDNAESHPSESKTRIWL